MGVVKRILVDTGAWVAYVSATDANRELSRAIIDQANSPLCTTWPVVGETISLLSRRSETSAAIELGKKLVAQQYAELVELTTADHAIALDLMRRFAFLRLSAADSTSCAVIQRLKLAQIATFDSDFRQVLPDRIILGLT